MQRSPLSWDHCRSFLSVHRTGSLSAAARSSGQTQPTIARHIAQLEQALGGGGLFMRSPQGLTPTETADALLPHALAMEASAAAMVRAASAGQDELSGAVRITASEVVSVEVLPPILADLGRAHPGLDFELVASNWTADLLRRDADIAVRMVRPAQSALVAVKVGDIPIGAFARRDYLERRGMPDRIDAMSGHALIGYDHETGAVQPLRAMGLSLTREMFSLRTDNDLAQLAAIRAGFGIGLCQVGVALRDPQLVRLFAGEVNFPLPTWITMHEDLRRIRRMRLVFDHLAEALRAYVRACGAPA